MKIRINLQSDLCTHSGETYNSYIDTDIVYDEYGFPYIPAKRIKGCIREACLELVDFGVVSQEDYQVIFGKEGNQKSQFVLDNAYLQNYEDMLKDIQTANDRSLTHPQKILKLYTYTRSQTAMSNGVAVENSLRTMRVVKKGCIFEAELAYGADITAKQIEVLNQAVRMVKHMGVSRTRGLGQIEMEVVCEEKNKTDRADNKSAKKIVLPVAGKEGTRYRLDYRIILHSPMICKSEEGNQAVTQNYISGSKVLGMLVGQMGQEAYQALSKDTVLQISNAYIEKGEKRCTPAAVSIQKVKDQSFEKQESGRDTLPVIDLLWDYTGDEQLTGIGNYYITSDCCLQSVDTEISYHHRRPNNKAIGRADGKDRSAFYQLESISRGQSFGGYILTDEKTAKMLLKAIPDSIRTRMGYGKNAEFGNITFEWKNCREEKPAEKIKTKKFAIKLNSPVIVYNAYGCPSADAATLIDYLKAVLGREDLELTQLFASYNTIGGYNVTWNARKQTFMALGAGTVIQCSAQKEIDISPILQTMLGERTREGYGEIELYKNTSVKTELYKDAETKASGIAEKKYSTDLIPQLLHLQEIQNASAAGRADAKNLVMQKNLSGQKEIDAVIGRMILMFRGEKNITGLEMQVEGIETDSKREKAQMILKPAKEYITGKESCLTQEERYKYYLEAYLGQIKYQIRPDRMERRA